MNPQHLFKNPQTQLQTLTIIHSICPSTMKLTLFLLLLLLPSPTNSIRIHSTNNSLQPPQYKEAPKFLNNDHCKNSRQTVHVAMTLDLKYLRGSIASVHSILKNSECPQNIHFHFITTTPTTLTLSSIIQSTFPNLHFNTYPFHNEHKIKQLISHSIRPALENPLNYARIYLTNILDPSITRAVYIDSDTILVDDIQKLWSVELTGSRVIGAPEYCHTNFTSYFNDRFWADPRLPRRAFEGKKKRPCYFNTGVLVLDLERWRRGDYTEKMEEWMEIQKEKRIYELGSLPPLMLVFGGEIEGIDHRWNQHGLGGDNVVNSCRSLHPGEVSLMHWSGKGKPWVRLDQGRPCPVDHLWSPYDLFEHTSAPLVHTF
ncbi:probable galacturonosyltransferase-like 10 [Andrographis paniculata]|uniref:probable galacturonosyltransferase-like 10 n=1 Tax=Andrographis paniculata TaxID=175694 RepID=UPI0021E75B29|nr:probable galacturonosyltransferase-like 10 [Andrographis paniculata]